jgi:uncharacterized membrane protein
VPARGDAQFEERLGLVLRIGVHASSVCLAIGLGLAVAGISPELSRVFLTIGLVTLLGTPVARVVVSVIVYTMQRDWLFTMLTMFVLLELSASVVAALVFHRRL